MKLSRTWKVILTVLLILSTLTASLFGTVALLAVEEELYSNPPALKMDQLYEPLLEREAIALFNLLDENIYTWEKDGITRTEIAHFEAKTGVNFKVKLNSRTIYTTGTSTNPLSSYTLENAYFNETRRFTISAYLYHPSEGTLPGYLYQGFQFVYAMRYWSWALSAAAVLAMLICSVLLILSAGMQKGSDEVRCSKLLFHLPYSILLILFAFPVFGVTLGCAAIDSIQLVWNIDLWLYCLPLYIGILWLLVVWLLCLTVKKCRSKTFWNTGILYRIGSFLGRKLFAPIKARCSYLWQNLSLWWKAGLLYVGQFILSGLFLLIFGIACDEGAVDWVFLLVFGWFILQIAFAGTAFITVINLQKLKLGAKRIKEGGLSEKIDTKQMYWEFKQHAETLNSIGDGVKTAVAEQMKSERFQTELITNVSHDIKTPMTSIINYVDLLSKLELSDPTAKEYIEVLTRQSGRLKKLTEDLVEASKAQSGALTPILENVNFTTLLQQAIGEYNDRFEEKLFTPVLRLPQNEVYLTADSRMLWRILDNLLSNICKYAMPGTRVYFDLTESGTLTLRNISREEITVADEELTRRFVRGDASRGLSSGSGLGLSIALSLTELMDGSLKVQTDGDLFKATLTLPLGEKPQPEQASFDI